METAESGGAEGLLVPSASLVKLGDDALDEIPRATTALLARYDERARARKRPVPQPLRSVSNVVEIGGGSTLTS